MAYADFEALGGRPLELYHFAYLTDDWFLTSGDEEVLKGADTYIPDPISRDQIAVSDEARTNNITISVPNDHILVSLFKTDAPTATVSVIIYRKQRDDPDSEWISAFVGEVRSASLSTTSGSTSLTCVPIQSSIERRLLNVVAQPLCNNRLYDQRCQVDRADWTFVYPVSSLTASVFVPGVPIGLELGSFLELGGTALMDFADNGDGFVPENPAHWLMDGVAQFGNQKSMISLHVTNGIWLMRPLRGIGIGDNVTLYAGCRKTIAMCRDKFNNRARFLGFPYMPIKNPFGDEGIA